MCSRALAIVPWLMPVVVAGGAVLVVGTDEDCVSSEDCGRSSLPDIFFYKITAIM